MITVEVVVSRYDQLKFGLTVFLSELSNALGDKKNMPIFVAANDNVVHVLRNVDQESHVDMFAFWCEYDSVNRYCTVSISLTV